MTLTMREVLHASELRAASLVAELSGYLVLGAADRIIGAPRVVDLDDVVLESEGAVSVVGGAASEDDQAESALRLLLARCLKVSRAGAPAVHRAASPDSQLGIRGLIAELEAALIPVNRAAGRRALARLHREASRAKQSGLLAEAPRAAWLAHHGNGVSEGAARSGQPSTNPGPRSPDSAALDRSPASPLTSCISGNDLPIAKSGDIAAVCEALSPTDPDEEEPTLRFISETALLSEESDESTAPGAVAVVEGGTERMVLPHPTNPGFRCGGALHGAVAQMPPYGFIGLSDRSAAAAGVVQPAVPAESIQNDCRGEPLEGTERIQVASQGPAVVQLAGGGADVERAEPSRTQQSLRCSPDTVGQETGGSGSDLLPEQMPTPVDPARDSIVAAPAGHADASTERDEPPRSVLTPTLGAGRRVQERSAPRVFAPKRSEISQLVDDFGTSGIRTDRELCRELQELAGVDATPGILPLIVRRD